MPEDTAAGPTGLQFPLEWNGRIIAQDLESVAPALNDALMERGFTQRVTRGNVSAGGRYVTYHVTLFLADRAAMESLAAGFARVKGIKLVL